MIMIDNIEYHENYAVVTIKGDKNTDKTLIDIEDLDFIKGLSRINISGEVTDKHHPTRKKRSYLRTSFGKKKGAVNISRLIMNCPNGMVVDHINGDTLDNRRANLRICSVSQNAMNQAPQRIKRSKYKGVTRHKKKWLSQINQRVAGKQKHTHLGLYDSEEDAARAYDKKAKELYGEFALLNFTS
jgi:hypothetical protein